MAVTGSIRSLMTLGLFVLTAACAPRGFLGYADPDMPGAATVKRIYSISNRAYDPDYPGAGRLSDGTPFEKTLYSQNLSGDRSANVSYAQLDISLPPNHELGQIEWARWQKPDAGRHFAVRHETVYDRQSDFLAALRREPRDGEVVLFVHGYNVNLGEAVFRMAQLSQDYAIDTPVISFSWPSAARAAGYVYDRDSVIFSRDALEQTLIGLVRDGHKVALVGHSMGSQLIMETLRQMSIGGKQASIRKLARVILMSPDIDEEVFLAQSARIDPYPDNFTLLVSQQDRALEFASLITGRHGRLGSIKDTSLLKDLPITVIDMSHVKGGDVLGHSTALTAPQAISQLTGLAQLSGQADFDRAYEESIIGLCVAVRGPELCFEQIAQ